MRNKAFSYDNLNLSCHCSMINLIYPIVNDKP